MTAHTTPEFNKLFNKEIFKISRAVGVFDHSLKL